MIQIKIIENKPALMINVFIDKKIRRVLVVSDLHIGNYYLSQTTNIAIDWYQIIKDIEIDLKNIAMSNQVDSIVLLGDIKNNIYKLSKEDWFLIPNFLQSISEICEIYLIPGNHDSKIRYITPAYIHQIGVKGMIINDILLTHGHSIPLEVGSNINKIIMGHVHPTFFRENNILNGQKVWLFLKVKKEAIFPDSKGTLDVVLVPSFNKYIISNSKMKDKKINSPILRKILKDEIIDKCLVVSIDGSIIRNENTIEDIF